MLRQRQVAAFRWLAAQMGQVSEHGRGGHRRNHDKLEGMGGRSHENYRNVVVKQDQEIEFCHSGCGSCFEVA